MTAFFIPGVAADKDADAVERAYGKMRERVELDMGRRPTARRIAKLWIRRGSVDCMNEVGEPDSLRGGTVLAIFDMGQRQPFVIWRQPDISTADGVREVLGCSAYTVQEFDP
jgi:hypothetical protein